MPNISLDTLERYLNLTANRQQAIATNMANVDTPGYKARDLDFSEELNRAMLHEAVFGSELSSSGLQPRLHEVNGLMERPDGNNVSLDREGMLLAETQLQHEMGVQLIKHHFHTLLSAINGGGQG